MQLMVVANLQLGITTRLRTYRHTAAPTKATLLCMTTRSGAEVAQQVGVAGCLLPDEYTTEDDTGSQTQDPAQWVQQGVTVSHSRANE